MKIIVTGSRSMFGWEWDGEGQRISGRTKNHQEGRLQGGVRKLECVIDMFTFLIMVMTSQCHTSQNFEILQVQKVGLHIKFKTGNTRLSYKKLLLTIFVL